MISLMIEVSVEEYVIDEWLEDQDLEPDDFEDHLDTFVTDYFGVYPDDVRQL